MSKFLDGNKASSFGQWLQTIPLLPTYLRSLWSVQEHWMWQGHLQVHGPRWGLGAIGIKGQIRPPGLSPSLHHRSFSGGHKPQHCNPLSVLLSGTNFPILKSHQWCCWWLKWKGKTCNSRGLHWTKTSGSFDIKLRPCLPGPRNVQRRLSHVTADCPASLKSSWKLGTHYQFIANKLGILTKSQIWAAEATGWCNILNIYEAPDLAPQNQSGLLPKTFDEALLMTRWVGLLRDP